MIEKVLDGYINAISKLGSRAPMHEFVREFGTARKGSRFTGERGKRHHCFQNAANMATWATGLLYVEGFVMLPRVPVLIHHAWCEDRDGMVIDPTVDNPEESEFIGIGFRPEKAISRMVDTGFWGLFAPGEMYDLDFIKSETKRRRAAARRKAARHEQVAQESD